MFDEMNTIPWHMLHHAFGPADDIPTLLKAYARQLQQLPDKANGPDFAQPGYELSDDIFHQSTLCEATPYVVPFLFEVAASSRTRNKMDVLFLLSGIIGRARSEAIRSREEPLLHKESSHWAQQILSAGKDKLHLLLPLMKETGASDEAAMVRVIIDSLS